jgi:hypothetical protein
MDLIACPDEAPSASAAAAVDALAAHILDTVLDMEPVPADADASELAGALAELALEPAADRELSAEAKASLAKTLPHSVRGAEEKLLKTVHTRSKSDTPATDTAPATRYLWTVHFVLIFEKQHGGVRQQFVKAVVHCRNLSEGCSLYDRQRTRLASADSKSIAPAGRVGYGERGHADGGSWGRGTHSGGKGRERERETGSGNGHGRGSVEGTVFRGHSGISREGGAKEGGHKVGDRDATGASSWGRGSSQPDGKPGAASSSGAAQRKTTSAYVPGAGNKPKRACSFFMNTFKGCANPQKCTFSHDMMLISQVEQCKLGCNCELRGRCPLRHIKKF